MDSRMGSAIMRTCVPRSVIFDVSRSDMESCEGHSFETGGQRFAVMVPPVGTRNTAICDILELQVMSSFLAVICLFSKSLATRRYDQGISRTVDERATEKQRESEMQTRDVTFTNPSSM
jgi:hypothetical protein